MPSIYERRTTTRPVELRQEGDRLVAFGYAAVFNARSQDLGGFVEIVKPGAFRKTVQEADVRALFNHEPNLLLGRVRAGTLRLWEDEKGLAYEIDLPATSTGRDVAELLRRGDVPGSSFGFWVVGPNGDEWSLDDDGRVLRSLNEVALRDVGPVTFPAYTDTEAAVRSLEARGVEVPGILRPAPTLAESHKTTDGGRDNLTPARRRVIHL